MRSGIKYVYINPIMRVKGMGVRKFYVAPKGQHEHKVSWFHYSINKACAYVGLIV